MRTAALIVAAGRGTRMGLGAPKQYALLGGKTLLASTVDVFITHPSIDMVQVVIHPEDMTRYDEALTHESGGPKLLPPILGGETRQDSVRLGLEGMKDYAPDLVLIQDAARPFTPPELITGILKALENSPAVLPGIKLNDTLKKVSSNGTIIKTVPREDLWLAQTPQGFHYKEILTAHQKVAVLGRTDFTDDAAIAEWVQIPVTLIPGAAKNSKITTLDDLSEATKKVEEMMNSTLEPRIGTGFDVHRFAEGTHLWLCGVKVPHVQTLEGHSDADVGLHALTDALLGTIGDGDIGQHFPPSDPQWKGAPSHLFLTDAARRVQAKGGRIMNVDITLLCELPKISPFRSAMQNRIAEILKIDIERVGIKATTTEGLGFTGRKEGIAALASTLVLFSFSM